MQPFLLDDKGESWPAASPALQHALGTKRTGDALNDFVIRNMGFIRIIPTRTSTWLELCPDAVSPLALTGLLIWTNTNPGSRLVLRMVGSDTPMVVRRREQINAVLGNLIQIRIGSDQTFPSRFHKTRIKIDRSPFAGRINAARSILALTASETVKLQMLEHLFQGFVTMSAFDTEAGAYRIAHMGERYGMFDSSFCAQARGKSFDATHDRTYGAWVAAAHQSMHGTTEPVVEAIHAKIEWPRQPMREFSYTRLMIPFRLPSGGHAIIGATAIAQEPLSPQNG